MFRLFANLVVYNVYTAFIHQIDGNNNVIIIMNSENT